MADLGVPPSPAEVRSFFTRWLDGANTGAWDTVAAMMHPEIELIDPLLPSPAQGRPASLERAKAQYGPFPDGRVTMVGSPFVSVDRPEIAYRWRFEGTHLRRIDPPGFAPTGRAVVVDGTSVLLLQGGQVLRVALYFDTTAVARQLLAAPAAGSALEHVVSVGQRVRAGFARRRPDPPASIPSGRA